LELADGVLSAQGGSGRRYPVQERIPILLPDVDEPAVRSQITAYLTRGASYYRDNYGGANPQRDARLGLVTDLLEGLVRPGADVLEAGAGPAVLAEPIRELTQRYVALDLSLDNLLAGRERAGDFAAVVGTLTALPFRDGAFDVVLAIGCLEYVPDLERALS